MYAGIFFIYLLAVNLAGLLIFHSDKKRAVKHRFRIPEARLFLIAILGGAAGCLLGMYLLRHKTKHARFVIGMPLLGSLSAGYTAEQSAGTAHRLAGI